jgi:3'(2'), 5'-bisphosphate nucleotidase
MNASDLAALRPHVCAVAHAAAAKIMEVYASSFDVRRKADASPVTLADETAEALIAAELAKLTPGVPIVAEEAVAQGHVAFPGAPPPLFWLVDPLDGTAEFVARNGQFAVCIGLVSKGRPVLGAVLAPAEAILWSGVVGVGAFRQVRDGIETPIRARPQPAGGLTVVSSRSNGSTAEDLFLDAYRIKEHRRLGSALKFGLLAEGTADLYPRFGSTSEWDVCAGEAVLVAAGGRMTRPDGRLLDYGKKGFKNPDFVATGAWDQSSPA